MDGKIEERVTMDVYLDTVVDFSRTITWCGNVYYLERNLIAQSPKEIKQTVEMVRWF